MKPRRILKISITDEARLQTVASVSLSPLKLVVLLIAGILTATLLGFIIVLLTPVKTFIPGYFRASQRAETQEALLRVDSISAAYMRNEAYLANITSIFNTERQAMKQDSLLANASSPIAYDSIMPPSPQETNFVKMMREKEKFNISVVAPVAAEGMLFYPVTEEGIITADSHNRNKARVILPDGASVMAVADGVVIASYYQPSDGGYSMILQHDNGFVSQYSSLGSPLVGVAELISGGQVIALPPSPRTGRPPEVFVRIWHDAAPLNPSDYITIPHTLSSF